MLRLRREPGLARRLADAGRELVMSRYSWQGVGPRWVSLYRSLAGRTA
jgi:glycosyltransferase involved in cell wall biosynthesis